MKTTILIPNYNGIKYLENCLESIFAAGNYPIIIVDNGSEDGSVDIAVKYQARPEADVSIIRLKENTGFCHAVNVGLKEVKTEYVFLLNNDTTILPDTIEPLERQLDADKRIFSAQSRIITMLNHDLADDCGDLYCALGWAFARGKNGPSDKYMKAVDIFSGCGAAVLYRMSVFEDIGMFDENHFAYLEDVDIGYRARIEGMRNIYEPSSVIYHAGSATSGSRYNKFKVGLTAKNSIYIIYKNMPIVQAIINLPFLIIGFGIKLCFFILKGMGGTYVSGLARGFGMIAKDARDGHRHKIKYRFNKTPNYIRIQLELWGNMIRRFVG